MQQLALKEYWKSYDLSPLCIYSHNDHYMDYYVFFMHVLCLICHYPAIMVQKCNKITLQKVMNI